MMEKKYSLNGSIYCDVNDLFLSFYAVSLLELYFQLS